MNQIQHNKAYQSDNGGVDQLSGNKSTKNLITVTYNFNHGIGAVRFHHCIGDLFRLPGKCFRTHHHINGYDGSNNDVVKKLKYIHNTQGKCIDAGPKLRVKIILHPGLQVIHRLINKILQILGKLTFIFQTFKPVCHLPRIGRKPQNNLGDAAHQLGKDHIAQNKDNSQRKGHGTGHGYSPDHPLRLSLFFAPDNPAELR